MPAKKKRMLASTKGGAERIPNFVATDADAHNIANRTPIKKFFTVQSYNISKAYRLLYTEP